MPRPFTDSALEKPAVQPRPLDLPETESSPISPVPRHVAVIMDGNGRWAQRRNLPRLEGHSAGISNIRHVIEGFAEHGVEYLTLYAFSTENWARPEEEVRGLLEFLAAAIKEETQHFHERGVRLVHLGRIDRLPPGIQSDIREAVELTRNNRYITVCIAFDYGGRAEILSAIKQIVEDRVDPATIDESTISSYLYTRDIPDPDLIVRTAGEMRLSNFLIWQSAYSEYYFTSKTWPEFDREEIRKSLLAFSQRQRRFGGINS